MPDDNKPKIQPKDVILEDQSTSKIIAETVSALMKELAPMLQANNNTNNNKNNAQPGAQTVSDVRSKVIRDMEVKFQDTVKANNRFTQSLVNLPKEQMTRIRIPKVYRKYFGPYLPVGINGVVITIPIDNNYHPIPKIYLPLINRTIDYEDEKIDYMERTGSKDIQEVTRETLGN